MDRLLCDCGGLDFIRVPRAVLDSKVVAGHFDQPVSGLHRDDQLRYLSARKNPAGCCEGSPPRPSSVHGTPDHDPGDIRHCVPVMETAGAAVPPFKAILRREDGPSSGGAACGRGLGARLPLRGRAAFMGSISMLLII